jgi:hypothetical protein
VFDSDKDLPVITKSLPTAGAILAMTGVKPALLNRRDGVAFEFPKSAEPALVKFLQAKRVLDRMVEEGA